MGITSIQWTDRSLNPIRARLKGHAGQRVAGHYCEKVSPGCAHCYSSRMQPRFGMPAFGSGQHAGEVEHFLDEGKLLEVLRRKEPCRWFWCDMTDLFGDWVPDDWLDVCFATMAITPQHTHQVLTKRPGRMRDYLSDRRLRLAAWAYQVGCASMGRRPADLGLGLVQSWERGEGWPLPNVWLGVSAEDQQRADERIPLLLQTPAAVRFVSAEPLLGPVDLGRVRLFEGAYADLVRGRDPFHPTVRPDNSRALDWLIIGGESGKDARPMDLAWARSLVAQCRGAGVPVFMKQVGAVVARELGSRDPKGGRVEDWPEDLRVREFPTRGRGEE